MPIHSIRWRLVLSYALIALLAALALGAVLRGILRNYYNGQEARYLQGRAIEIGAVASRLLTAGLTEAVLQDQARNWSFFLQARVRVENGSGKIIADSGVPEDAQVVFIRSVAPFQVAVEEAPPHPGGAPESFQIEIMRNATPGAEGPAGDVIVFNRDSVDVAIPVDSSVYGLLDSNGGMPLRRSSQIVERQILDEDGQIVGKLILSDGPAYGDEILKNVSNGWIVASLVAVVLAGLAGWVVSRRITTPLMELTEVTSRMSHGDLSARAGVRSSDEIGILGRSFNDMAARVEEMVATLRSFVADAAHEIHTPLTALQTNLELAREAQDPSTRSRYLARAREQGLRLEALVDGLLELSRLESVEAGIPFVPVEIVQLVREAGEQFASRAEQMQRSFQMRIGGGPLVVQGDRERLRQVIMNVLENALKFTPADGSISLALEPAGDDVRLIVTDSGIGIPAEDLPRLFDRFHRGRNASAYPGSGLGLAITKSIVTAHQGTVSIDSPAQRGTIVSISLPKSPQT